MSGSLYACNNSLSLKGRSISVVHETTHLPSDSIRRLDSKQILIINQGQKDRPNSIKDDQRQANYTVFY